MTDPTAEPGARSQDALVDRLRPDPAQPPTPTSTLVGFLGRSDRDGWQRVYFSRQLDHYAQFRSEDVLMTSAIPADAPPFVGDEATRVTVRASAVIEYTRTRTVRPADPFDLDVRFGRTAVSVQEPGDPSAPHGCMTQSCEAGCPQPGTEPELPQPVDTFNATLCVSPNCVTPIG